MLIGEGRSLKIDGYPPRGGGNKDVCSGQKLIFADKQGGASQGCSQKINTLTCYFYVFLFQSFYSSAKL